MTTGAQAPPTVQATALSTFGVPNAELVPALVVGSTRVPHPAFATPAMYYWYVVVNLKDLSVAVNVPSQSESHVPVAVTAYLDSPNFFLFVIGNALNSSRIPEGELHAFLQATGAGDGLAQLKQMIGQLGTSTITAFSYVLAATMSQQDIPGFEAWSYTDVSVLTMQFIPVEADGQWAYAPIQQGAAPRV
jgi:hypothetical protein